MIAFKMPFQITFKYFPYMPVVFYPIILLYFLCNTYLKYNQKRKKNKTVAIM